MGKAYDIQFHLAPWRGSVGTMVCAQCGQPINPETEDFREAKKSDPQEGWGFVVHHRRCLQDQARFVTLEKRQEAHADRCKRLLTASIAFREEWEIDDLDELIEALQ